MRRYEASYLSPLLFMISFDLSLRPIRPQTQIHVVRLLPGVAYIHYEALKLGRFSYS